MLLLRYANDESFSADSRGGGKESNVALIVYLMQMGIMCASQCQTGEGVREAIEKMHRQAVKALIQAGGGSIGTATGEGAPAVTPGAEEGKEGKEQEVKTAEMEKEAKDEEKNPAAAESPSEAASDVDILRSGKRRRRKRSSPASTRTTRSRKKQRKSPAATAAPASASLTTEEQRLIEMYTAAAPPAATTAAADDDSEGMWEHAHLDHWLTILAASLLLNSYEEWTAMRWAAVTKLMSLAAQQANDLCGTSGSAEGVPPSDEATTMNEDSLSDEERAMLFVQRVAACRPVLLFISIIHQLHLIMHKPPFVTPPPPYPPPTAHWSLPTSASSTTIASASSAASTAATTALLATRWSFLQRFDGQMIRELQSSLLATLTKHSRTKHDKDTEAEAAAEMEDMLERLGVMNQVDLQYGGSVELMMRTVFQRKAVPTVVEEEEVKMEG